MVCYLKEHFNWNLQNPNITLQEFQVPGNHSLNKEKISCLSTNIIMIILATVWDYEG